MVALSLKCNFWSKIFKNLNFFLNNCKKSISHIQHTIFISAGSPFHTLGTEAFSFQVYIIILYFYGYKGQ